MKKHKNADNHISKAHDHFFRKLISDNWVAKEFFEAHLPENLLRIINLSELELQSGTFIDDLRR